jgi:hypothetical protein
MMRGLFGKKAQMPGVISGFGGGTFNMDGTQSAPMQGEISYTPQAQAIMQGQAPMPEQRSFWQGGGKFTGRDALAGALAAIGDGLRGWSGGPTGAVEGLLSSRMAPAQEAAAMAAEQRKRAAELADFRMKEQIKAELAPAERDAFDRALVAGGIDPNSPEGVAMYRQRAQTMAQGQPQEPRMVTLPDGRAIFGTMDEIQRILQGGAPQGGVAPNRLPANFFDNGPSGRQNAATNPAPRVTGARRITPQQYQRQLRQFNGDQTSMNAWMRANNVLVD